MLVAGVGNIFLSDDGFGVEVVARMAGRPVPDGVELVDFGIRGVHLAYQLLDGYDVLVLVDASPRGRTPGTVSLLEVDQSELEDRSADVADGGAPLVDAHGLEPGAILSMLGSLGGQVGKVLVVACEPESVEEGLGLSRSVQAAIPQAITLVEQVMQSNHTKEVSR
jgi:hydrogenase maturation protease